MVKEIHSRPAKEECNRCKAEGGTLMNNFAVHHI